MSFCQLHRHSEFSRLDGLGTARQYAALAAEKGQLALGQTDHGTLSGALHHVVACSGKDSKGKKLHDPILPISGVEAYYRPNRIKAKQDGERKAWHLCLYAKNLTGWHNLLKLVSAAYSEPEDGGGFYQYPCVDQELLTKYSEGLACSSACISSWLSYLIDKGDSVAAAEYINQMLNIFGEDFWIEIMPHDFDGQRELNQELIAIAHDKSIPLLATNDVHFPYEDWADTHRIAKILGSGSCMSQIDEDEKNGKADYLAELTPTLYLCGREEMVDWFDRFHPGIPKNVVEESLDNTMLFVQKMNPFLLDKNNKLPKVTKSIEESENILRQWIDEGLQRIGKQEDPIYLSRVEEEWAILKANGVIDYFVMVGDIVRWCRSDKPVSPGDPKKKPIRVGLGRGSAAGCLISYLVGIVGIDPISYGLLFERFLNPGRKGLPDIDLDFDSERRAEVKAYIASRYGQDHVADIITHTTFQPKKVIQDLCRVYDTQIGYAEAKSVTDTIDIRQDDEETTLEELLPLNQKLREFSHQYPEIWKHALRLEGGIANAGKHAAGIIITPQPITEYMALERGKKGDLVTSWSDAADFPVVSDHGLVKLDALGITGLTKHEYACNLIEQRTGEKVDLDALPALTDPYAVDDDVMQGFRDGYTTGVFQFGSSGITSLIKSISPDSIFDLAAANALYRPGPMKGGVTWDYAKLKEGEKEPVSWHPSIDGITQQTFGLMIYQEQAMQISKIMGGFTLAEADDLRKAMGKLYRIKGGKAARDYMKRFQEKWFEGCKRNGLAKPIADDIWAKILHFGGYTFNLSHSACYALQAYQDMWLKIKYPAEFYAAFLTYEDDEDKVKLALREAQARGIEIAFPDINKSDVGYTVDQDERLLLGLSAIKGIGPSSGKLLMKKRPFYNLTDFFLRGSKDADTHAVIVSGALDEIMEGEESRAWLLSIIPKVNSKVEKEWTVWEHLKHNVKLKNPRPLPENRKEPSPDTVDRLRAKILNLPVFAMNLDSRDRDILESNIFTPDEIAELPKKAHCIVGGELTKIVYKKTKKGGDFANATIVFESYEWNVKLWSGELARFRHLLEEGQAVMVSGKKDEWNGYVSVVAEEITLLSELRKADEFVPSTS